MKNCRLNKEIIYFSTKNINQWYHIQDISIEHTLFGRLFVYMDGSSYYDCLKFYLLLLDVKSDRLIHIKNVYLYNILFSIQFKILHLIIKKLQVEYY